MPINILVYSIVSTYCFVHNISLPVYVFIVVSLYAHTLYALAPSPLFLHTHWEFWLFEFAHSSLCMLPYGSGTWRGSHALRRAGVPLLDCPFSVFSFFSLFLLLPWFCALNSVLVRLLYSSVIMCGHLYVVLHWY